MVNLLVHSISKTYDNRKVVNERNLMQLKKGEVVGLLRPQWGRKNYMLLYDSWFNSV